MEPLHIGPSRHWQAWQSATHGRNDRLLASLAEREEPGVVLFMLASYMNGLYRGTRHPLDKALGIELETEQVAGAVRRVLPVIRQIQQRLKWPEARRRRQRLQERRIMP